MAETLLLVAMKGLPGAGKSTIARALSRQLGWPLIDKDDVKDILDGHSPEAGSLAYEIMFHVARRQLLQGLSVICDSPLTFERSYTNAQRVAAEATASLAIIECSCSDEAVWRQRINARQALHLPSHHTSDWQASQSRRSQVLGEGSYRIVDPHLVVDTIRPVHDTVREIVEWLNAGSQAWV